MRPDESASGRSGPGIGGVLAVAVIYFAAAKVGFSLAFMSEQVSLVWPPTGIAVAAVLLYGYRLWPGIALGAFAANATANEPLFTACGIALGNTLEAVLGAWLLLSVGRFDRRLERIRDVLGLVILSAGLSTIVSATIGVTSLCASGVYLPVMERAVEWTDFGTLWWVWWLGDSMGALIIAPLILTWANHGTLLSARRFAEAAAILGGLVVTSFATFAVNLTPGLAAPSFIYAVFPFVVWAALRFGQLGTTTVTPVAASLAIWATVNDLGPFSSGPIHDRLLLLQVYMGVVAITALLLGAALCERRRSADELRHSEQLLKSTLAELKVIDRRKDEFLATLAHELRNPLAPIRMGLELMKTLGNDPAAREEIRLSMEQQTEQLITLVNDLIDVSRITRGAVTLRMSDIELCETIRIAIETARPLVVAAGHELVVQLPNEPIYLTGDAHRLAQVFSNLLNNAAKYTPDGGRIWVTAEQHGLEAEVIVRDTGMGIPLDMQERIFELFSQLDCPTDRIATGLGVGLTLVKSLVEMHGGTVVVRSGGANAGSEFTIRLPICMNSGFAPNVKADAEAEMAVPACRALIVDDHDAAANLLCRMVKMLGCEVRLAYNGQEAVRVAEEFLPDVILMDLGMPQMDGYEAARMIREQPWGTRILLVAVSGWGQDDDKVRSRNAGFDQHFVKPADPAVLRQVLLEATSGRPAENTSP